MDNLFFNEKNGPAKSARSGCLSIAPSRRCPVTDKFYAL
jgi:hypothetical protein